MAGTSGLRTLSAKVKTHLFSQSCLISLVTHHVLSEPQQPQTVQCYPNITLRKFLTRSGS